MRISITDAQETFIPVGVSPINAPFVTFSSIDLTGDGGTVFISVSLDPQEQWSYGYFMNSRFLKFKVDGGKLECIAKSYELPTFRKTRAADAEETVQKSNRYIAKLEPVEDPLFDFNSKAATCHY